MMEIKKSGKSSEEIEGVHLSGNVQDTEFDLAMREFRSSVHTWSEESFSRPRAIVVPARHHSWRLTAGWAMGCMLAIGSATGLMYEKRQKDEIARIAAAQHVAEEQKLAQERQAKASVSDEVLLAGIDSDVSRQVPSAMEPLVQAMDDSTTDAKSKTSSKSDLDAIQ